MSPVLHMLLYVCFFISIFVVCSNVPRRMVLGDGRWWMDSEKTMDNSKTFRRRFVAIQSKRVELFYFYVLISSMIFAFLEGHRYDRGVDWFSYKERYMFCDYFSEIEQPLYYYIMKFCHFLNFDYIEAFSLYAFWFIFSLILFIRLLSNVIKINNWVYFLALYPMMFHMENLIREFVAIPFLFFSVIFYVKKQWTWFTLMVACSITIHSSTLLPLLFFVIFYCINKTIKIKYSITILLLSYTLLRASFVTSSIFYFLDILHISSWIPERFSNFIIDSDRWFGADSILADSVKSPVTQFLTFIFEASVLYVGYYSLRMHNNRIVMCFYNLTMVSFIVTNVFYGFEIVGRLFNQLYFFWFIPAGYGLIMLSGWRGFLNEVAKYSIYVFPILKIVQFVFFFPDALFTWDK